MNLSFLIPFILALYTPPSTISIEDAIAENKIQCVFHGHTDTTVFSSHYGKCLQLTISASSKPVNVSYKAGQLLAPGMDEVQQIILTESGVIALKPNEEKVITLYGMCSEKYDAGPSVSDTFFLNGLASADMTGLADLIAEKNYQSGTGQSAMWVLSDDEPLANITGDDVDAVNELRKYVASVKKLNPEPYQPQIIYQQREMHKLKVVFEARIKRKGTGKISLYNPDGTLNDVLIENQDFYPGIHRIKFWAESLDMQTGIYKVVLEIDGVKHQEEYYRVE